MNHTPFVAAWIFTIMTFIQSRKKLNLMKENTNQQSRKHPLKMHKNIFRTVAVVLTTFTVTVLPIIISTIISLLDASVKSQCSPNKSTITFFASTYIFIICKRNHIQSVKRRVQKACQRCKEKHLLYLFLKHERNQKNSHLISGLLSL